MSLLKQIRGEVNANTGGWMKCAGIYRVRDLKLRQQTSGFSQLNGGFSKSQTHVRSNESLPLQSSVSSSSHCSISPKTQAGESLKAAASSHIKEILVTATRCRYQSKTWKI